MKGSVNVLGINYGGHDASAALMIDGKIVSACEEERYNREKHSRKFPRSAIADCLQLADITIHDVDEIAFGFDPIYHIQERYVRGAMENSKGLSDLVEDFDRIVEKYDSQDVIRQATGYTGPIEYYKHHECHLASAYYPSGFSESLIASYDGIGEVETGLLAVGRKGNIEIVDATRKFPHSLGLIYSAITYFLGWTHHCDEGIVMGLATYGNPESLIPGRKETYYQVFEKILVDNGGFDYEINLDWINYHKERDSWISKKFISIFGEPRDSKDKVLQHHMDLAAALQKRLEVIVINQLERLKAFAGSDRLCLAGGVALNCSMNGKIESSGLFKEIFIQPASGDAGVALGACYLAQIKRNPNLLPDKVLTNNLGGGSDNNEIIQAFKQAGLNPIKSKDIFSCTSEQLANGKIIGWYQGRSEFGPRALGNRSIITRPYPADMKDYLNARVKFRESFRPFAPAVMSDHLRDYFQIGQESPHMLIACQATEAAKLAAPATVHVDNSCRVQSVSREGNEKFYDLLNTFYKETGCPILLNTSFNVKGQPIVNTAQEAIDCFLSTNIDYLVVGDYVVDKEGVPNELLHNPKADKNGVVDAFKYFGEKAESYGRDYQAVKQLKYPANLYRLNIVEKLIKQIEPKKILDIATGTAEPLIAIKKLGFDIEGFDLSDLMLTQAKQNLEKNGIDPTLVHKNDMENPVGLGEQSYDCLLALGAVYYARDFAKTMKEMTALLLPEGDFIFSLRNSLFSLYASNESTTDFLLNDMVPSTELSNETRIQLEHLLSDVFGHSPIEKTFQTDAEQVYSVTHNPFTITDTVLEPIGLKLQNIYYYHFHALPPIMEHSLPDEFRRVSSTLEGSDDWRAPLMSSSFVVHARKSSRP